VIDIGAHAATQAVADLILQYKFFFTNEEELQAGIWEVLQTFGAEDWQREFSLSKEDRIDFFYPPMGIGIEAKISHPLSSLTRQVHRYCQHDNVRGIVIVTSKAQLTNLPESISNKPVIMAHLITSNL